MIKFCPFDERFRCGIWIDNEVLRYAEEESAELFLRPIRMATSDL